MKKPIEFSHAVDVKFGELDPFGHVNAKHYLDIVATSRLKYLDENTEFGIAKTIELGFGYYLKNSTINYRRPIVGLRTVVCKSFVSLVQDSSLFIEFRIEDATDGKVQYADGRLEYVVVNLRNARPTAIPPWMTSLFFEGPLE